MSGATNSSNPSTSTTHARQRVVIVPGNGCGKIERANWYKWLQRQLEAKGYDARCESMPDPDEAKEKIWIPFIREKLEADENTILIGHSSGAEAGMRFLETYKLKGLILVSACHTDLGVANETISGYYSRPWLWDTIRSNAGWIVQFHSKDDPFIPIEEARYVAEHLKSEYIEHEKRNHYMHQTMPDIIDILAKKCAS